MCVLHVKVWEFHTTHPAFIPEVKLQTSYTDRRISAVFSTYNLFMAWRWEKVPGTKWEILLLCKNLCDKKKNFDQSHRPV